MCLCKVAKACGHWRIDSNSLSLACLQPVLSVRNISLALLKAQPVHRHRSAAASSAVDGQKQEDHDIHT